MCHRIQRLLSHVPTEPTVPLCAVCAVCQVLGDEVPPAAAMARSLASGGLTLVSGEQQLNAIMTGLPSSTLLVAMFGLSGNTLCQATARAVRVSQAGPGEAWAVYAKWGSWLHLLLLIAVQAAALLFSMSVRRRGFIWSPVNNPCSGFLDSRVLFCSTVKFSCEFPCCTTAGVAANGGNVSCCMFQQAVTGLLPTY